MLVYCDNLSHIGVDLLFLAGQLGSDRVVRPVPISRATAKIDHF
jgi:hypothetical protein